jgi:hypothetical protein
LTHNFFWEASNFGKHSPPGQHGIVQSIRCRIGCVRVDACFSCQAENRISIRFAWNRAENQTENWMRKRTCRRPLTRKGKAEPRTYEFCKRGCWKSQTHHGSIRNKNMSYKIALFFCLAGVSIFDLQASKEAF